MKRLLQLNPEDPSQLLKEIDTATQALQSKVDATMRTLLSLGSQASDKIGN